MPRYDSRRIESKWQLFWDEHETFVTSNQPQPDASGKMYVLDMFPYPSGSGLHVGHPEGYTATDIVVRFSRMKGKHVLHPMGWDAFGLPAEQHAIKTGTHPRDTTHKNIETFKRQLKMLGFSYDWSREISTTDEDYYRWTQWIFLQLFDTWYDSDYEWTGPDGVTRKGKGRPISELPIPSDVVGDEAVRRYQDAHRLAYQSDAPVNWCPALGTVLANEEVLADGTSEVGGHPVERRPLRQWMLRITSYAERLIDELSPLDWPESVKLLQRNWIGKSTGAEVDFRVESSESGVDSFEAWKTSRKASGFPATPEADVLRVYTTRPDTLYGATYMVVAPEHPIVDQITTDENRDAVIEYRRQAGLKSELDRTELAKEKTGVFTGAYATNPINGQSIPIWVADYVMISYGTGAIMAVPAHDERDLEFAQQYNIEVIEVVDSGSDGVKNIGFTGEGTAINSGDYNGLSTAEFKQKIAVDLAEMGVGRQAVNYKLRDWLFSRQRYWGEPFPLWHELDADGNETGLLRTVPENQLPVTLPDMEDFKPKGTPDPPLNHAPEDWLFMTAEDGTRLKRETNSMPQWAGSCWYYLRFCDNKNSSHFIDPELEKYWLPVDLYIGGVEHAVLHLLYARFWHKVLFDLGHLSTPEPFHKLVNQGMILGDYEYFCSVEDFRKHEQELLTAGFRGLFHDVGPRGESGSYSIKVWSDDGTHSGKLIDLPEEAVIREKGSVLLRSPRIELTTKAEKMSKSRGNVVNPDDVVDSYGADSLRLYEMFMGPLEQTKPWQMSGVEGVYRFLGRVWRMIADGESDAIQLNAAVQDVDCTPEQERLLHKTIKAVTQDVERLSFNTAISRMMEFTNEFSGAIPRPKSAMESLTLLLAPFAPHLAEECWQLLGHEESLTYTPWPTFDESKLVVDAVEVPIQINGKLRAKIMVPTGVDASTMQQLAESDEAVQSQLAGKTVVKVVAVPGRMVNFVVK